MIANMVSLAADCKAFPEHVDAIQGKTLDINRPPNLSAQLLEIPNLCLAASTANSWITPCNVNVVKVLLRQWWCISIITEDVNLRKSVDTCVNTRKSLNTSIVKAQTCAFIFLTEVCNHISYNCYIIKSLFTLLNNVLFQVSVMS